MRKYAGEKFIKVDDVRDGALHPTIAFVKEGRYGPEAVFEDGGIFNLNQTNIRKLIEAYGPNSDDWVGKKVALELGSTMYDGALKPTVVVTPESPPLAPEQRTETPAARSAKNTAFDDEIPF